MGDNGLCQILGTAIQIHFHRCANCGAVLTLDEFSTRPLLDGDRDVELCEACTLAQPGSDEFV